MVRLTFQKTPGQVGGASWRNAATVSGQSEDFLTSPFWAQESSIVLRDNKEAREYKWRDRNVAPPYRETSEAWPGIRGSPKQTR